MTEGLQKETTACKSTGTMIVSEHPCDEVKSITIEDEKMEKISKGLEALSKIKNDLLEITNLLKQLGVLVNENYPNEECNVIEKELKAFELLKYAYKSKVFFLDIDENKDYVVVDGEGYHYIRINKEKYDLLKEVLK